MIFIPVQYASHYSYVKIIYLFKTFYLTKRIFLDNNGYRQYDLTKLIFFYFFITEVPRHRPSLSGIKPRYRVGDILWANCTSSGSRPAANITWLINGKPVSTEFFKLS